MASNLSKVSSKLDSFVNERASLQEEEIQHLTEEVKVLTEENQSQANVIAILKSTNQTLRKRALELIKANEEIRQVTHAYLAIASVLKNKPNLSVEENEIVKSAEKARIVINFSSIERTLSDDILNNNDSLPRENKSPACENEMSRHVTVIRQKSLKTAGTIERKPHEEHPNMQTLLRFPLFASFPQDIMEQVSLSSYELHRKMGQLIVKKGEEGAEIFFLTEGVVSVVVDDKELSVLQAPIFFGELGVLFKFQRTATVIAKTDSTMVVVTKQKLDEIISQNNDVKRVVDSFAADKESWWKKQQYIRSQEKFGAEFAHDIAREDIRKLGIFASAPDAFVDSLATAIKCLVYSSNQNIVSVDEDSDAMYFILDGSVEVVGSTGTVHAEMSGGAFFGEVGVLLNMKRTASIRAKEESHVFKLTKQDLDSVIGNYPSMKHILKTAADERYELFKKRSAQPSAESKDGNKEHVPDQFDMEVAGQSLAKLSLFSGVGKSVLSELAMKMIRKTWEKDEKIIVCNAAGESMFFLAAGNADVITEFGDVIDTVSGPSAYFGEVALLEQVPRTATVKCSSVCSTYELRKDDFKAVLSKYPQIANQIKNTADERMQNYLMRNVLA